MVGGRPGPLWRRCGGRLDLLRARARARARVKARARLRRRGRVRVRVECERGARGGVGASPRRLEQLVGSLCEEEGTV